MASIQWKGTVVLFGLLAVFLGIFDQYLFRRSSYRSSRYRSGRGDGDDVGHFVLKLMRENWKGVVAFCLVVWYFRGRVYILLDSCGCSRLLDYVGLGVGDEGRTFVDAGIPDLEPISDVEDETFESVREKHAERTHRGLVKGVDNYSSLTGESDPSRPDDWLVYDEVIGVVPQGVQDRWKEEEALRRRQACTKKRRPVLPPVRDFSGTRRGGVASSP